MVCRENRGAKARQDQQPEPRKPWPVAVAYGPVKQVSPCPGIWAQRRAARTLLGEQHTAGIIVVSDTAVKPCELLVGLWPVSVQIPVKPGQALGRITWSVRPAEVFVVSLSSISRHTAAPHRQLTGIPRTAAAEMERARNMAVVKDDATMY